MGQSLPAEDIALLVEAVHALAAASGCNVQEAASRIAQAAVAGLPQPAAFPDVIRTMVRLRTRRNERLCTDVFRDPAWDMLLELVAAHHERRAVSVSALCFASGVPATTALRYIERMAADGLIVRAGDFDDQRRILVEIAPERFPALEALMRDMLASAFVANAPAVSERAAREPEPPAVIA